VRRALVLIGLFVAPLAVLAAAPGGMVTVPSGSFRMGGEVAPEEKPVHSVTLPAFHMDRFEVTNAQFEKFIAAKGYATEKLWSKEGWAWRTDKEISAPHDWAERKKTLGAAFGDHPVVGVSYYEAEAYARFAKKRLPTEIEWEKAARGTAGRTYPWGDEANEGGPVGGGGKARTYRVGSNAKDESPYGVKDLGSNVAEWTSSWYGPYPGSDHEDPNHGKKYRVIRGGSWRYDVAEKRRGAWRGYFRYGKPTTRAPFIGIRLVSEVKAPK